MMLPPMGDLVQLRHEREQRLGVGVEATRYTYERERSTFQDVIGMAAPIFMGVFAYLVSYGLLLTFGLLALLGLALGFATLLSPSDLLVAIADDTPTSPLDRARNIVRIMAFGTAFLAFWPAWLAGSVTNRHLNY